MRKPLPILALLALAAASSAQVFTLSPVALGGYTRSSTGSYTYDSALRTHASPAGFSHGWCAEFALPTPPIGTSLVFARFGTRITTTTINKSQRANVWTYEGTGTISASGRSIAQVWSGSPRVGFALNADATPSLGTGRTVGFSLSCDSPPPGGVSPVDWSTPTLAVGYGYTVRIPLSLDGYRGDITKIRVRFDIRRPGTTDAVHTAYTSPDANGVVQIGVPTGTYDLALKPYNWLRRTLKSVAIVGPTTLPTVALVNGDADGNNVVNAEDRAMVTYGLGTVPGQDHYHPEWDMNGDGVINALDRAIVTARLGSVGDL